MNLMHSASTVPCVQFAEVLSKLYKVKDSKIFVTEI